MLERIQPILSDICGLHPNQPIVVGVSGGPDSVCLLDLLHKSGYPLVVACLNHGLRPEAGVEASVVRKIAEGMGVDFSTRTVDTNAFASQYGLSTEAAARQLRYDFLFAEARKINAQAVVVGHTADDQAETILLHLLRGTGLAGLRGMEFHSLLQAWSDKIPIVRPLLTTWRSEILEYCEQNHLVTIQDSTNQSLDYLRNRIRHEIIPYLVQIQPRFRQHLVLMASTLAVDYSLVLSQVEIAWKACLAREGNDYVGFTRKEFLDQPVGVQRYLIRKAMLLYRTGLQDVEYLMIERACNYLAFSSVGCSYDLGAGLRLMIEQDLAWIATQDAILPGEGWPAIPQGQSLELPVPGRLVLQDDWVFTAEIQDVGSKDNIHPQDFFQARFDVELITMPVIVRPRLPGDRIKPLGMGGKSVKLSDLMINRKLPYRSRAKWPVVCSGEEIVWVPGCQVSDKAQPSNTTRQCLHLTLAKAQAPGELVSELTR